MTKLRARPGRGLHENMMALFKQAPVTFLRIRLQELIASKLPDAPASLVEALSEHLLSGGEDPFEFDDGSDQDVETSIDISQAELDEILASTWAFVEDEMPGLSVGAIEKAAKVVLKGLYESWPEQRAWQLDVGTQFRGRLEQRWGAAFDILRMIYTVAHELGSEAQQRGRRSRAKKNLVVRQTLLHLHARACQVVAEIICLIENGFADGAMARWRTLHEIVIVAAIIAEYGDDLAIRYRAHEAVEAKRAMDRFRISHAALGFAAPSQYEIDAVERQYDEVLKLYGNRFGSEYGWAAHHLSMAKPRFIDLEQAAGKLEMRSYYVMASYNVHASPKGLAFRLGLLKGTGEPTAMVGASNVGFVEPAQNAAADLVHITALIVDPRSRLDRAIELKILILLRDQIAAKLDRAHRGVVRAHNALRRRQAAALKRKQKT